MKRFARLFLIVTLFSCSPSKPKQSETRIEDINWKLVELNNKVLTADDYTKPPTLVLMSQVKRIAGNGGCNTFFGIYELPENNQIRFSTIGATKMACNKMQVENDYLKALSAAHHYSRENNFLLLSDSTGNTTVKFEFVSEKK